VVGTFGSSVGSLFNFARWLFFLNVLLFVVWSLLVLIPQSIHFDYSTVTASFSFMDLVNGMVPTLTHPSHHTCHTPHTPFTPHPSHTLHTTPVTPLTHPSHSHRLVQRHGPCQRHGTNTHTPFTPLTHPSHTLHTLAHPSHPSHTLYAPVTPLTHPSHCHRLVQRHGPRQRHGTNTHTPSTPHPSHTLHTTPSHPSHTLRSASWTLSTAWYQHSHT